MAEKSDDLKEIHRKNQALISSDIDEANRKSVIAYSTISMAAFIAMTAASMAGENAISKNKFFYMLGTLIMAFLALMNFFPAKKHRAVTHVTAYLFVVAIFGIGIMLAVSSANDVTASYMVFLFVAPLLFTLKPFAVNMIIAASDLFYIFCMHGLQTPDLFQKNLVNAIIYGILSMVIGTTMTRMRMQKFETDFVNRVLMETDQLTGMLNRRSFEQHIEKIKQTGTAAGMKICAFDVNGLKLVNDNIGHHAGDELLRGAAACLEHVFSNYGYCYRIGGDEFAAILQGNSPSEAELQDMLDRQMVSFKGNYVPALSMSMGIVEGGENDTVEDLLKQADAKMYASKAEYYGRSGRDRRKRP